MSAELVPAATSPADIAAMPPEQRGQLITHALVESRSWLAVATRGTDPTPIAEFRAWAATVAEMTKQRGLAEEIQLDALEMVRRAERGIGLAVRNGQDAGEILRRGEIGNGRAKVEGAAGNIYPPPLSKPGPAEAAGVGHRSELVRGVYPLTDGVTDDQFEQAIGAARDEKDMSRANVKRKLRGERQPTTAPPRDDPPRAPAPMPTRLPRAQRLEQIRSRAEQGFSSYQIGEAIGIDAQRVRDLARQGGIDIPADAVMLRSKHVIDPARVIRTTVEEIAGSLDATWSFLNPSDFAGLDPDEVRGWINSLTESMRAIRRLQKELTHHAQF